MLALGVAAVVTGPIVGGLVPAAVSFALAKQARDDLVAGRGYLTGARQLRIGLVLAWIGVGLGVAALVVASIVGLLSLGDGTDPRDFPTTPTDAAPATDAAPRTDTGRPADAASSRRVRVALRRVPRRSPR